MAWSYIAQRVLTGEIIDPDLPLTGVSLTDTLSGPGALSGSLPLPVPRLVDPQGNSLLREWDVAIWAEEGGVLRGGGIIDKATPGEGGSLSVECVGFSGMLQGQPYTGDGMVWTKVDPLEVVRHIWGHWQSYPDGNLHIRVDGTTSPIRIGEEQYVPIDRSLSEFDTTFDDGPIRLNWWDTHDLGGMIDGYVEQGYFDYHEEVEWNDAGGIDYFLRLYYPRRGARKTDLRFVYGENVTSLSLGEPEEGYASEVMFLGAGEGREKIKATAGAQTGRVRRVAVVNDDNVKRKTDASTRARKEFAKRGADRDVQQVTVRDHPHAPLGSWQVGDEIRVLGTVDWQEVDQWVRITSSSISPESGDIATLEVQRQKE